MSGVKDEVIQANVAYAASFGEKTRLALPPARGFLILTCMDARLDSAKFAGLAEGDAHVVRNAGGRASEDAIRSLVISHKLLGTREWFVIHHTDCGSRALGVAGGHPALASRSRRPTGLQGSTRRNCHILERHAWPCHPGDRICAAAPIPRA